MLIVKKEMNKKVKKATRMNSTEKQLNLQRKVRALKRKVGKPKARKVLNIIKITETVFNKLEQIFVADDDNDGSKEKAADSVEDDDTKEDDTKEDDTKDDDTKEDDTKEDDTKEDDDTNEEKSGENDDDDDDNERSGEELESVPEEELGLDIDIPTELRPRDHVDKLLKLDEESSEIENILNRVSDITLRELKKLYENAIKPLEVLYKYRDLSNRHFGDAEIFSKPLILFMGPWSGGKSSIINYLVNNEYNETALKTGKL